MTQDQCVTVAPNAAANAKTISEQKAAYQAAFDGLLDDIRRRYHTGPAHTDKSCGYVLDGKPCPYGTIEKVTRHTPMPQHIAENSYLRREE